MSAGLVRSFTLLAIVMMAVVTALVAVAIPADAASKRALPKCSAAHIAKLKSDATKRASKVGRSKRLGAARRKALRASLIAQAVKSAGCSGRTTVTKTTSTATSKSTVPATTAAKRPAGASDAKPAAPAPSAPQPAPQTSQSWWTGMQGGANDWDARVGAALGAKVVRVEFEIGTSVSAMREHVAEYADRGVRILPLAGFHGRLPSVAEAQNVATWAREFGPNGSFWAARPEQAALAFRQIEFGNETSFAYQGTQKRGGDYARRVRDAATAMAGTGVGLLVQGDNANQSDDWVGQMYAAVSNLHDYVAGWTVHPYGPQSKWQNRIDDLISQTADHGAPSTIPVDITEWGLATDNGHCLDDNYGWNKCMTYQQAAEALSSTATEMRARYGGRIRHFLVYNGRDLRSQGQTGEREHYFGLVTLGEQDKGAFTAAARTLFAAG